MNPAEEALSEHRRRMYGDAAPRLGTVTDPDMARTERIITQQQRDVAALNSAPYDKITLARRAPQSKPKARPGRLDFVTLTDVAPEKIEWLWTKRIAIGKITVLFGPKGNGKSFATHAIAAALSRGEFLKGDDRVIGLKRPAPAKTLLLSFEDGLGDTLRVRLERLKADLSKVRAYHGAYSDDGKASTFTPDYLPLIEQQLVDDPEIKLVVIDPVMAILGHVDAHRDNEVRAALEPLREIAERRHVAVLLVAHTTKTKRDNPLDALHGSVAFGNLARNVLYCGTDPHEPTRRAITRVAGNISGDTDPIAFRITPAENDEADFEWEGAAPELDAQSMMNGAQVRQGKKALEIARDFLLERCASGRVAVNDVHADATAQEIAIVTLRRAFADLKDHGVMRKDKTSDGHWDYVLVAPSLPPPPPPS